MENQQIKQSKLKIFSLDFEDETENDHYNFIKNQQNQYIFQRTVIFSFLWQCTSVIVQKFIYDQSLEAILILSNILIFSLIIPFFSKNIFIFNLLVFIQGTIYEGIKVKYLYILKSNLITGDQSHNLYVCYGFGMCMYIFFMGIIFNTWYLKTIKISISLIILPFSEGIIAEYSLFILFTHLFYIIFTGLMFYVLEKNSKEQFHFEYFQKIKLMEYKKVFEQYLPNELVIISKDKEKMDNQQKDDKTKSKQNQLQNQFQFNKLQNKNIFTYNKKKKEQIQHSGLIHTSFCNKNLNLVNSAENKNLKVSQVPSRSKNIRISSIIDQAKQQNLSFSQKVEKLCEEKNNSQEFNLKFPLINKKFIETFSQDQTQIIKKLNKIFKNKISIYQIIQSILIKQEQTEFKDDILIKVNDFKKNNEINNKITKEKEENMKTPLSGQQQQFKYDQIYELVECFDLEQEKYFDITIICLYWDGLQSVIVLFNDISNTIIKKRLEQVQKHKDLTLASITHDLRTPLNFIKISSEQCQQENNLDNIKQLQNLIQINCELLMSLINDILDSQQIQVGNFRLVISSIDLNQLFQQIFELFKIQCQKKNIKLQFQVENNYILNSDKNRIKQILINLISNAIKFTQNGQIFIKAYQITSKKLIAINVKDTGCGIPQYLQNKLFSVFNTFDHYNGTNKQGVGIGLSLCKTLVSQLGPINKIFLNSEQNKGSIFTFVLHQDMEDLQKDTITIQDEKQIQEFQSMNQIDINTNDYDEQSDTQSAHTVEQKIRKYSVFDRNIFTQFDLNTINHINNQSNQHQIVENYKIQFEEHFKKILIVDDIYFNILALKFFFQNFNIQIDNANNGMEAFNKYKIENYSLILMDLQMPIMNGHESIKLIRQYEKEQNITPSIIIINSANISQDETQQSINCGANEHIGKPVDTQNLKQILQKFFV